MTPDQKIAALAAYALACLLAPLDLDGNDWYGYCTDRAVAAHPTSWACVFWWAMRHEAEDPEQDWIGYMEHVARNHDLI